MRSIRMETTKIDDLTPEQRASVNHYREVVDKVRDLYNTGGGTLLNSAEIVNRVQDMMKKYNFPENDCAVLEHVRIAINEAIYYIDNWQTALIGTFPSDLEALWGLPEESLDY